MDATDLCFTPATELVRLISTRRVSPVEVTEAVLRQIERLNPRLRAFLTVTDDRAREEAKAAEARALKRGPAGPLDGVPYSIKDLEPTAGIRTTYGSKFFEHNVPEEDGVVAGRLRTSGGVLLGKTNTPHFGHKDMCDNLLGPPCRNPWKLDRTSGGSSGGAAAAVAAGLGPLAQGSDGAGSIRIPSALCGVFGLKPSFGRVPYHPNADYWSARSHNGPLARTVRDAALMLNVMAGADARDPLTIDAAPEDYVKACDGELKGLRVAWSPDLGYAASTVASEVKAIAERAARRFSELGCRVEAPALRWPDPRGFHKIIWEVSIASRYGDRAIERPEWIEPSLMQMFLNAGRLSAIEYGKALVARSAFYQAVRTFFDTYDLLLTPQMPVAAWSVDAGADGGPLDAEGRPMRFLDRVPFMYPFNFTGQPAANVPCGFTAEGLPVGLQIVGRWHADALVLRAAAGFEAVQPWAGRRPALD
ncbi:MAG TPA: amidase family protein [bacterium]|nr:amidase family protein [bacterium]